MTNNFDLIKKYMINEGIPLLEKDMGDLFFVVMLVRRGKDHPDLPAANYTFKSYYFDSIEKFDKLSNEMIKCCEIFGLRAYVSVNVKSKEEFSKMCSMKFAQNILNNEYKKPWRVSDHVFGKITAKNDNTWLVDIDNIDTVNNVQDINYIVQMLSIINSCDSKYDPVVIGQIPTRSGIHILARPFNVTQYRKEWDLKFGSSDKEFPDIKKNHITLLYENIDIQTMIKE